MSINREIKLFVGAPIGAVPPVRVSQYDTAWTLIFTVYNGQSVLDLTDVATAVLVGIKEDETVFAYTGTIGASNITVDCQPQMTSASGSVECELRMLDDENAVICTSNFELLVEKAPLVGYVASGNDFDDLSQLINESIEAIPDYVRDHLSGDLAADALKAEGFAVGQQNGEDVASGSPYYENNAKYWAEEAADSAATFETDPTLTVEDKAADAKATGERICTAFPQESVEAANVITFPDGADGIPMKSLAVNIPVTQDLHGYSKPWPAGGGKNKLALTLENIKAVNADNEWADNVYEYEGITYTVLLDNGNNVVGIKANGTASNLSGLSFPVVPAGSYILNGCPAGGSLATYCQLFGSQPENVDDGNGASITLASDEMPYIQITQGTSVSDIVFQPMVRLSTEADATFEPYSNVCPITGYTGLTVTRAGKNLLNEALIDSTSTSWVSFNYQLRPNTTYTASTQDPGARFRVTLNGTNHNISNGSPYTFTTDSTGLISIGYYSGSSGTKAPGYWHQIEAGSSATAHEAYVAPTSYPVDWTDEAGTIYGGTLDVVTGEMKPLAHLRLGDLSWSYNSGGLFFYASVPDEYRATGATTDVFCLIYAGGDVNSSDITPDKIICFANSNQIRIRDKAYSNGTAFYNAIKNYYVVYQKRPASQDTVMIDPQQVTSLLGYNTVWADKGTVAATYRADPKMYVDAQIAAVMAATANL